MNLLMVTRSEAGELEAEPVTVDRIGDSVSLTLDDGSQLIFSLLEFLHAASQFEEREAA